MTFLTGIWGYVIAGVVSASLAAFGSYKVTHAFDQVTLDKVEKADLQAKNDAVTAAIKKIQKDQADIDAVDKKNAVDTAYHQGLKDALPKEVTKYVTVKADTQCILPFGFTRLLDAAGQGTDPDTLPNGAAEPLGSNSGLSLSAAATLLAQTLIDADSMRQRLKNADEAWRALARGSSPAPAPAATSAPASLPAPAATPSLLGRLTGASPPAGTASVAVSP